MNTKLFGLLFTGAIAMLCGCAMDTGQPETAGQTASASTKAPGKRSLEPMMAGTGTPSCIFTDDDGDDCNPLDEGDDDGEGAGGEGECLVECTTYLNSCMAACAKDTGAKKTACEALCTHDVPLCNESCE